MRGLGREEYSGLVTKYEEQRRNKDNMVKRRSSDQISLIPWEKDITILVDVSKGSIGECSDKLGE